ncbi:MAG: 5-formyltetrahydrofolate cyclo-ligase [Candidatus Kapaibacterium sp.]|nr:MAG: 5-formyltetrahydrofolate cyclo-ligase [Candidatus Kapabacteria bacterium]
MTKAEIRALKLAERAALSLQQQQQAAIAIAEHLWAQPEYLVAPAIHVYLPIRGEVDTQPIIERAWKEGKRVVVPVVLPGERELQHALYAEDMRLEVGQYGIPQPAECAFLGDRELAELGPLVLVPLVAFGGRLYRIGYGKGYYDRFLARVPFRRFGLAYALQYVEDFPVEPHDVPLDAVVTELGVVRR